MNLHGFGILVSVVLIGLAVGSCNDQGDPTGSQEPPVTASQTSVILAPGASTTVVISGGRAPYGIIDPPDTSVASAVLTNPSSSPANLVITAASGVAAGRATAVKVGDADELEEGGGLAKLAHDENEVTINITISTSTVVSFSSEVQPIFTANCALSGCHAGANAVLGLNLETGQSYSNLLTEPAAGAPCAGEPRVSPGNSAASVLYKRISGTLCGSRMPFSLIPGDTLTTSEQSTIRAWIDQGALNN
jgi:hypothetical protein